MKPQRRKPRKGGRPKGFYTQAARVLTLHLELLRAPEGIDRDAMAAKLGVCRRTINRDFRVFAEVGVDVSSDKTGARLLSDPITAAVRERHAKVCDQVAFAAKPLADRESREHVGRLEAAREIAAKIRMEAL